MSQPTYAWESGHPQFDREAAEQWQRFCDENEYVERGGPRINFPARAGLTLRNQST